MDRCLLDFEEKGEDDFSNLKWESQNVKAIDFEVEHRDYEIWEFQKILTTARVPKKKDLKFLVIEQIVGERECWENWEIGGVVHEEIFDKEQDARDFFEGQKAEMEWFGEKNKEGKVFDGRRYMWEVIDGKITGKRGWD